MVMVWKKSVAKKRKQQAKPREDMGTAQRCEIQAEETANTDINDTKEDEQQVLSSRLRRACQSVVVGKKRKECGRKEG